MYVARAPICVPDVVGGFAFGIAGGSPQPEKGGGGKNQF